MIGFNDIDLIASANHVICPSEKHLIMPIILWRLARHLVAGCLISNLNDQGAKLKKGNVNNKTLD